MEFLKSFCINAGLKEPIIQERNDFVDVEFYRVSGGETENNQIELKGGQVSGQVDISEKQAEVLKYIIENPRISRGKLSEKLGINPSAVQKHIDKLKTEGIIRRIGKTTGYWEIIVKG